MLLHVFTFVNGGFQTTMAELSSSNRDLPDALTAAWHITNRSDTAITTNILNATRTVIPQYFYKVFITSAYP